MFEFLAFIVGIMIMGPIVFIYFSLQELKKRIENLEVNLKNKWENFIKINIGWGENIIGL